MAEPGRVYDDQDQQPVTRPNLRAQEGISSNTTGSAGGGATSRTPGAEGGARDSAGHSEGGATDDTGKGGLFKSGDKSVDPSGLASAEGSSTLPGEKLGSGYTPAEVASGGLGQLRVFLGNNKRKAGLGGGIVGAIILLLIFGFAAIVTHELVDIEKDLLKNVAKIEQHFEKKAAQDVMQKVIKRLQEKTKGSKAEKKAIAQEDSSGDALTSDIDSFPITEPQVMDALAKQGIKVQTDGSGNFTGLRDADGNDITDKVATDSSLFDSIETALPEWDVNQLKSFEPLMTEHAGSTFSGLPEDTDPNDVDKTIESDISNGASSEDVAIAENSGQESDGAPADKTTPTGTADEIATNNQEGGALGKALSTTNQDLAKGESGEQATEDGVDSFNLGDPIFASSLATMACNLKQGVTDASKARVPLIMSLLIRHFSLLISLADELKSGKLSGPVVNKTMQLFNGDSSTKPTASNPRPEASLPFTSSAAWQRATGGTVNSDSSSREYTPDISKSALPTANSGTQIVNEVDGVTNKIPGANLSCSVLTSGFGFIVQGIAGIGQLIGDIGSFGASQAAITAGILAGQQVLQRVVLPDIIKYFTPVGVYGGEDAVQWMNNSYAGGLGAFSDYGRNAGGEPLTNGQADTITASAGNDQVVEDQQMSWTDRTFALSNPDSLVSRLSLDIPLGLHQTVSSVASVFTTMPTTFLHSFGELLTPRRVSALGSTQNPCQPYGITCYGLTDSQVDKYDVIQNGQYLQTTVSYGSVSTKRIDLAGDPHSYQNGTVDSSTTDLMHCFNQSFDLSSNPTASEDSYDPICASMGNYDYATLPPKAMTDDNVAVSYCDQLTGVSSSPSQACINAVMPQLHDDIGHFQQYIADTLAMNGYNQIAGSQ